MYYKSLEASFRKTFAYTNSTLQYYGGYEVVSLNPDTASLRVLNDDDLQSLPVEKVIDLRSDQNKLVLIFHPSIAHALQDSMPLVMAYSEVYPEREVVIFTYPKGFGEDDRSSMFGSDLLETCVELLEHRGISVTMAEPGTSAIINKFDLLSTYNGAVTKSVNLFEAIERGLEEIHPMVELADKKLYISRKNAKTRNFMFDDDNINEITTDDRVFNEAAIEQVFEEMGFEIVYAEEFDKFKDQLAKMRLAKVVAGVTGAGLSNFMLTSSKTPNRLLLEITSPVVLPEVREDDLKIADVSFHPHYWQMAASMQGAQYSSIGAGRNRDGETIAHNIRNSHLFDYLSNY
jgi:hypothetical protein